MSEKNEDSKSENDNKGSSSESERSTAFDPDVITEDDIEKIWLKMNQQSAKEKKRKKKLNIGLSSTDTTPTTDYNRMYIPLQPESLKDVLEIDKEKAKMDETLRMKKVKPKTYLTQVILYENVSHDRLLDQKLGQLKHRHRVIEKKIKRKRESFVQQLENKQNEWTKLDARVIQKFEPENMPDLSFKFGRLYHSANYPYQAAINALRGIPSEKSNHTRKPQVLPQITRKKNRKESIPSDSESGSSNVFITKLPKKSLDKKEESMKSSEDSNPKLEEVKTSWEKLNKIQPDFGSTRPNAINKKELPPVRGRRPQKIPPMEKNWLEDSRYVTLTSLLGPRFSPSKKFRRHDLPSANLAW